MKREEDESGKACNSQFKNNVFKKLSALHPNTQKELILKYVDQMVEYIKAPSVDNAKKLNLITKIILNGDTETPLISNAIDVSGNIIPDTNNSDL